MKIRPFYFALIIALSTCAVYAQKPSDWLTGTVSDAQVSNFTRVLSVTTTGHVDKYGNYSAATRPNTWNYVQTLFGIEDGEFVHLGRQIITYRWQKRAQLTPGNTIKYFIKKDIIYFIDSNGRKIKARLLRTVSKAELAGESPKPFGLVPQITSVAPVYRWSLSDSAKACEEGPRDHPQMWSRSCDNANVSFFVAVDLSNFDNRRGSDSISFFVGIQNIGDTDFAVDASHFRMDIASPIVGSLLPLPLSTYKSRFATAESRRSIEDMSFRNTTLKRGEKAFGYAFFDKTGLAKPINFVFVFKVNGTTYEVPFGEGL